MEKPAWWMVRPQDSQTESGLTLSELDGEDEMERWLVESANPSLGRGMSDLICWESGGDGGDGIPEDFGAVVDGSTDEDLTIFASAQAIKATDPVVTMTVQYFTANPSNSRMTRPAPLPEFFLAIRSPLSFNPGNTRHSNADGHADITCMSAVEAKTIKHFNPEMQPIRSLS